MDQESLNGQHAGDAHAWHALAGKEAVALLESSVDRGLSVDDARRRLERTGPNALPEPAARSLWAVFLGQFASPLIYLLLVAAVVALALGHRTDAVVIFTVVVLNALIGSFQEGRAERSIAALRRLSTQKARLVRGGEQVIVPASAVVPGDILLFEAGAAVAADARLLHCAALQIAEAALTGESVPVSKDLDRLPPDTLLADRRNMVYAGTHVSAGRGTALVVATGVATEIGQIAALAEAAVQPKTPLERRVAQFGRYIMAASAGMFVAITGIGLLYGIPLGEIVMVGISQIVGMIPEGLPVAMTIALAVGVQRMTGRRCVVRRLAAVETLGSTSVICSDKTGTLTRNEMTVTAVWMPDGRELAVAGAGYEPVGRFSEDGREFDPRSRDELSSLLEAVVLCNDARLQEADSRDHPDAPGPSDAPGRSDAPGKSDERAQGWKPIGDPTEVALVTLAIKAGIAPDEIRASWPRQAEIPFDSATKLMATQHASPAGPRVILKGAPEALLALCGSVRQRGNDVALDASLRRAVEDAALGMAERALRVLAVGVAPGEIPDRTEVSALRGRVTLLGLLGQIDPPRTEVKDAVERCREAGIRPVMVTGDHKATGYAIARELGIAREGDVAVDGRELEQMSDDELAKRIEGISVFARVHPAQKLRIVGAYQKRGEVVAMTGDGVNDAPALVKADVGVAMGIAGTEVAKESAEIVIGDDDFATIVAAVEEGRVVYRNIKKAVLLLFSTSAAEVIVLLLAMLLGYPPPFAAVQILWNNLVSEGLITINLVMEPPEGDEMQRPPIAPDEPLLSRILLTRMAFMVPAIVASTLGWFVARSAAGVPAAQVQTEAFTLLLVCEWFNVLNCRSESRSAFSLGVLQNRWLLGGLLLGNVLQVGVVFWAPLGRVFHTVPIGLTEVVALGAVGSLVLWVEEARKLLVRRRERRQPALARPAKAR